MDIRISLPSRAGICAAAALLAVVTAAVPGSPAGTVPARADAFVNAIGVDSHFSYRSGPEYLDYATQRDELVASGIRHLRDGAPTSDSEYLAKLRYFGEHGITHTLGFPVKDVIAKGAPFVTATLERQAPYVDAVEAGNEYDKSGDPDWVEHLRAAQQVLYDAVKASSFKNNVTVLSPSLSSTAVSAPLLGPVPADAVSLHNATCDDKPTTKERSINIANLHAALQAVSAKPIWATETGYDNDQSSHCYIAPQAAALYTVTTVAERWNTGEQRVYFDDWSDEPQSRGFRFMGLVPASGAPKPQYQALKSMIAVLSDKGPSFTPQPLDFAFTSASPDVHSTLLEKRDGTYYLLLWLDIASWDRHGFVPLSVSSQTVSISLPASIAQATAYRYASNWSFQASPVPVRAHAVGIPVTAALSILELRPAQ